MLPLAPGRFSSTKGWPNCSDSDCPMMRAKMSTEPPGGKPTTTRTGRSGQLCADARRALASRGALVSASNARRESAMRSALRWRRGLRGLEAQPRKMLLHVGREVLGGAAHRFALLPAVHVEQHRQDVDVGERETVARQIAGLRHRAIEHVDLRLHLLGREDE